MSGFLKKISFVIVVLVLVFLITSVYCEAQMWNCPECGRTGNTGNYCGGCAHPAPWLEDQKQSPSPTPKSTPTAKLTPSKKPTTSPTSTPKPSNTPIPPISITDIHYKVNGGYKGCGAVDLTWQGGGERVFAHVYHWFNEQHNSGVLNCLTNSTPWYEGNSQHSGAVYGKHGVIDGLVPGERYWIVLSDDYGNSTWQEFKVPKVKKMDFSISLKEVYFYTSIKKYGLNGLTTNIIEKTCPHSSKYDKDSETIWISVTAKVGKISNDKEFSFGYALILPNGDVFLTNTSSSSSDASISNGLFRPFDYGIWWDPICEAYGAIPSGKYTFEFIVDDYIVGTKTINLK